MKSLRGRLIFLLLLTVGALYYVSPTFFYFSLPKEERNDQKILSETIPDWLPEKHIKLGLDLQGGVQLVLGVDTDAAIDNKLSRLGTEIARWANDGKTQVTEAYGLKGEQQVRVILAGDVDPGDFKVALAEEFPRLEQAAREGKQIDFRFKDSELGRIRDAALEQAERVVRNRVDKWGVAEPLISRRADGSVLVQLPGFKDPERARELLGRTAQLKFKLVDEEFKGFAGLIGKLPPEVNYESRGGSLRSENKQAILDATEGLIPEGRELLFEETQLAGGTKTLYTSYVLKASTELSGEDVLDANVTTNPNSLDNRPAVSMRFTGTGGKRFGDLTRENVGKRMAIVLDNVVVSAPYIEEAITGGTAQISMGSDRGYQETAEEAQQLSLILRSGALPAPITILEERQVGATLGPELANQGVSSVLLGLGCVFLFMMAYYRRPGILSAIALGMNGLFLLTLMASFGFSLTLPGFAGFILTLGMAVDANVLINERIRQEMRDGKSAKKAVENGFGKVFWTIVDSNVTTLIAAAVLIETNSSGPIKGFAVALILGLLVSMFTSLFATRVLFDAALSRSNMTDKQIRNWLGAPAKSFAAGLNIDFLKFGKVAAGIGLVIVVAVFGLGSTKGFNWSVDFAGGTEVEVLFDKELPPAELRSTLNEIGVKTPTLQAVGNTGQHYLIRFDDSSMDKEAGSDGSEGTSSQAFRAELLKKLSDYGPDLQRVDFVGPLIGSELRKQGVLSVLWAIIGILIYIGFRFDMRFGPGAVYKMVQDVFVILGFYLFFQRSFDLTSVAALLTVVGYSVNDTIVIYDRIRENLGLNPRRKLYENINFSLNETLTRTINTSITTIIALSGVLIFGSSQIWNFAAAMAVGVISATLTSMFLASSFILWLENWKNNKNRSASAAAAMKA